MPRGREQENESESHREADQRIRGRGTINQLISQQTWAYCEIFEDTRLMLGKKGEETIVLSANCSFQRGDMVSITGMGVAYTH